MAQYVTYDQENNVLFADYTDLTLRGPIVEEVIAEVKELSATLVEKVYLLSCFQNTKVIPNEPGKLQEEWGNYVQRLLEYVKGVVRYAPTDFVINVTIRTSTVAFHQQDTHSYLFPTKEAALEAIRGLQQDNQPTSDPVQ